jgi:hypothetical protein
VLGEGSARTVPHPQALNNGSSFKNGSRLVVRKRCQTGDRIKWIDLAVLPSHPHLSWHVHLIGLPFPPSLLLQGHLSSQHFITDEMSNVGRRTPLSGDSVGAAAVSWVHDRSRLRNRKHR